MNPKFYPTTIFSKLTQMTIGLSTNLAIGLTKGIGMHASAGDEGVAALLEGLHERVEPRHVRFHEEDPRQRAVENCAVAGVHRIIQKRKVLRLDKKLELRKYIDIVERNV
jgi:hypothetical protein